MATVLMFSLAQSPGVTTAAVATTRSWHRNAILIEADTSTASAVLTGYFQGQYNGADASLINLAVAAAQHGGIDHNDLWSQLRPLDSTDTQTATKWLLPGLMEPKAAPSLDRLWGDIISAADTFEAAGTDVIIDAGRWAVGDVRSALMRAADAVLVFARPTLPSAWAIRARLEEIRGGLSELGRGNFLSMVAVEGPTNPYTPSQVASSLGLPLLGTLPWDPRSAAVFSDGSAELHPSKLAKRPYTRAIHSLSASLQTELDGRRRLLQDALDAEIGDI